MSENVTTKLEVKKQWFCDLCGDVIESDKDGMLEWDRTFRTDRDIVNDNFKIVHGRWLKSCNQNRPTDKLADGHLHWYTGPEGLNKLLTMFEESNMDIKGLVQITKRLHVDYYEEGIKLIPYAREDGSEIDPYDNGDISQYDLKHLIKKYGKNL